MLSLAIALCLAGVPDTSLGLSHAPLTEVSSPPAVRAEESVPGEKPAVPRVHPAAAPVIPHGVAGFLPITRDSNLCVECHAVKVKQAGEPTPIPPSHYVDLRRAPGKRGKALAGARHVCTSCHVERTDAAPLVENRFAIPGSPAATPGPARRP